MRIKICVKTKSLCLAVKTFVVNMSDDMRCNNIDIRFASEADSMNAFTQLKEMGVKCYHTGKNAPNGASVMMYSCDRNIFNIQVQS